MSRECDRACFDLQAAVHWYAKAAALGDAKAQFRLGVCYQYGRGIDKDAFLCSEYYNEAAEQVMRVPVF